MILKANLSVLFISGPNCGIHNPISQFKKTHGVANNPKECSIVSDGKLMEEVRAAATRKLTSDQNQESWPDKSALALR